MFACSRDRKSQRNTVGMFDLWLKVQEEMLCAWSRLPSLPPSELSAVFGCCQQSALPVSCLPSPSLAFPPSESSLQEIKGFVRRSRVSSGVMWLSEIAGRDRKTKLDSTEQIPETKLCHYVKEKLSLW